MPQVSILRADTLTGRLNSLVPGRSVSKNGKPLQAAPINANTKALVQSRRLT